jgi:hypothetical protein
MATRGQGGGRGRGAGRGSGARGARGGGNNAPLAAQLRQLDRLQEPEEMAIFRRLRDLDPIQVRSVYGPAGLLQREILIGPTALVRAGQQADGPVWLSTLEVEALLNKVKLVKERESMLARRETRLPEARRRASWGSLTPEEKKLLSLSQRDFNSFRAQQDTKAPTKTSGAVPASKKADSGVGPRPDPEAGTPASGPATSAGPAMSPVTNAEAMAEARMAGLVRSTGRKSA